jgi:hypothetical protein
MLAKKVAKNAQGPCYRYNIRYIVLHSYTFYRNCKMDSINLITVIFGLADTRLSGQNLRIFSKNPKKRQKFDPENIRRNILVTLVLK